VGSELRMKRIDCNTDVQRFEIVPFFQCAHELHERLRISERFPARSMRYATLGLSAEKNGRRQKRQQTFNSINCHFNDTFKQKR